MDACLQLCGDGFHGNGIAGLWPFPFPPSSQMFQLLRLGLALLRRLFQFLWPAILVLLSIRFVFDRLHAAILLGQLLHADLLCTCVLSARLLSPRLLFPNVLPMLILEQRPNQCWIPFCE